MMKKYIGLLIVLLLLSSFKKKQFVWVAIGDSITYLNDHPDETANRITRGYLSRVTDELPDITYINQGHNGWRAKDIADSIERLKLIKADVYTIFLGTNDWWNGRPVGSITDYEQATGDSTFFGSCHIIINKIRKLNSGAKLVLITPMQRGDFVYILDHHNIADGSYKPKNGQSLEQFANAVLAIGTREHIPVIDLYHDPRFNISQTVNFKRVKNPQTGNYTNFRYPDYIGIPFNPATDEYPYPPAAVNVTYDGLHPSDKGHGMIAAEITEIFKKWDL